MKSREIDSFFKRKGNDIKRDEEVLISSFEPKQVCKTLRIGENECRPSKVNRVNPDDIENYLECDPGTIRYLMNSHPKIFSLAPPL